MSCSYSRQILALHIENDLPPIQSARVARHVNECTECRQVCAQLQDSQSFLKTRLKHSSSASPAPELFTAVRRRVLSRINDDRQTLGWAIRLERALLVGFRRHRYAFASATALGVLSMSLLAQMRHAPGLEGQNTVPRLSQYREWVLVGSSASEMHGFSNDVYMNPLAYRAYTRSGTFPEGTVIVLERANGLQASVKDDRFQGGWGFFDFRGQPQAVPDETCRSCHEEQAETDHVFTQFYPMLRSARLDL
jgi:hypothetical protein